MTSPRAATWALGLALAVPLVVYASIGWYARYTADDYCWAGILRTQGFLNAQVQWYTQYSPRYAFTFIVNLVELAGPAIVPFLPPAAIAAWVATLTWTFRQFQAPLGAAFVLAELVALATFHTAPDLPQSLYWQTGMLTYLLPLVLATFLVGWIRRGLARTASAVGLLVSALVTFVAGGLSETYLIPQNVALTLALGACLWWRRWTAVPYVAAALAGGVLALLVIVIAPATTSRVGGAPADLWLASSAAIATAAFQVGRLGRYFPFTIALCLVVPVVLGVGYAKRDVRGLWLLTAIVAIVLPFCYFPSFYAQNGNPPARSLIVPGLILIAYLVVLGWALTPWLGPALARVPLALTVAVLCAVPLAIAALEFPERAVAAEHAALWDAEDALIRERRDAGDLDPTVPEMPPYLGEKFVTDDREHWFNGCVARYYGLRSIATSP